MERRLDTSSYFLIGNLRRFRTTRPLLHCVCNIYRQEDESWLHGLQPGLPSYTDLSAEQSCTAGPLRKMWRLTGRWGPGMGMGWGGGVGVHIPLLLYLHCIFYPIFSLSAPPPPPSRPPSRLSLSRVCSIARTGC